MAASTVMSAFIPTSSGKNPLAKTIAYGSTEIRIALNFPSKCSKDVAVPPLSSSAIRCATLNHQSDFIMIDLKHKTPDMNTNAFCFGWMVQDSRLFKQNFLIRSYDVGADQRASIEALMSYLQEAALNHANVAFPDSNFGLTPEMTKRNLISAFSKIQFLVDRYPSRDDIVEVETWAASHSKIATRREWHVRDYYSGQTILRGTSVVVMMNKSTRKLVKVPEDVRNELEHFLFERGSIIDEEDNHELSNHEQFKGNKGEKHLVKDLTPKWGDLDPNHHVNNVKYIAWILESVPMDILENQEVAGMTIEYRRECGRDSVIHSETTVYSDQDNSTKRICCDHLLSLESGVTVLKARTTWRPKKAKSWP